jgi:hypothetical protein
MAADPADEGLYQLDNHYNTFIVRSGEPMCVVRITFRLAELSLSGMSYVYSCGKNIRFRVNLDLHTVAGSQNGSFTDLCDSFIQIGSFRKGRSRSSQRLDGLVDLANAQRTVQLHSYHH